MRATLLSGRREMVMASGKGKVAAGLLIYRKFQSQIEYLQLKTSYGKHHWTPPKGHVDPGESELETAKRETEEEAGLREEQYKIKPDFQRVLNYEVGGKPKRVVYWLAELTNPESPIVLSDEHTEFVWQPLAKAIQTAQYEDMQKVLKEAQDFIDSNS